MEIFRKSAKAKAAAEAERCAQCRSKPTATEEAAYRALERPAEGWTLNTLIAAIDEARAILRPAETHGLL